MDENKYIVIDGVGYELSPADWKLHQQILSRATVVNVTPEKLTDAVVERLVGHKNVVYYNCETNAWNTNKYNGYTRNIQDLDTDRVKEFKSAMDKEPKFSQRYEFAASIIMTIDRISFPGQGKLISNPLYNQRGTGIVGNIIVKNKTTGKYELYCKSWVGSYVFNNRYTAVSNCASGFAFLGAWNFDFRRGVLAAHVVQDDKTPQVKSAGTPDILTDAVVERLVGHTEVVYYNCEINAWNTNKYKGYMITAQESDAKYVKKFKTAMEKESKFSQHYEFVAPVIMTIGDVYYPGWAKMISHPQYSYIGNSVVGNIIVKNKATGKYELYCKSWVGVIGADYPFDAYDAGSYRFADDGASSSSFRVALIAAHAR